MDPKHVKVLLITLFVSALIILISNSVGVNYWIRLRKNDKDIKPDDFGFVWSIIGLVIACIYIITCIIIFSIRYKDLIVKHSKNLVTRKSKSLSRNIASTLTPMST